MKKSILLLLCISLGIIAMAQTPYKPNPKAKQLDDSAVKVFSTSNYQLDKLNKVGKLLEQAVKIDPKYFEGWINLLSFQGRINEFAKCKATSKKISELFPNEPEAFVYYGIMLDTNGKSPECLAQFAKALKLYTSLTEKNKNTPRYKSYLTQQAVMLIFNNREKEGRAILRKMESEEKDGYQKSYLAFYINSDRLSIIKDRIPGR